MEKDKDQNHDENGVQIKTIMKIKPLIAGILLITSGMIFIDASRNYLFIDDDEIDDLREQNNESLQNFSNSQIKQEFLIYGVMGATLSAFCLIGGVLSLFRKKWKITFAFSILSVVTIIFLFLIMLPLIFTIIALIMIYFSKNDFKTKDSMGE